MKKMTGLSLEDIFVAFRDGNWASANGRIYFGGPNWAEIAATTIQLRDALLEGNDEQCEILSQQLEKSKHNTGYLVNKFSQL